MLSRYRNLGLDTEALERGRLREVSELPLAAEAASWAPDMVPVGAPRPDTARL